MTGISRREILTGIAGSLGSAALAGLGTGLGPEAAASEYLFEPGLNYLNTAALGPTPRFVLDAVLKAWQELETNPVMTSYGNGASHVATDRAREQLAGLIGCQADELLITRSATVAMNSIALGIDLDRSDRVLTTDVEHEGGTNGWKYLKKHRGVEIDIVTIAATDHDVKSIVARLESAIAKDTKVLAVSHVVSATGLRLPIADIAAMARRRGILCIVDGAQAVGCIDVNVKNLGCHAYIGTGHKWLMGPKGTGFAYISKDAETQIRPVERMEGIRFVAGSTGIGPLPLVVGLGAAAEAMRRRGMSAVERRTIELRDRAYAGLKKIPKIAVVSVPPGPLATALVSFSLPASIPNRDFRALIQDKYKIVLKVGERRFNGIRISPHVFNTEAEIDSAVNAIRKELNGR